MATCPRLSTGDAFLSTLLRHIDCQAKTLGENGYLALANPSSPMLQVVTALLTIFVALFGFAMMMGRAPSVRDTVMAAVKIGVVLTLAMSWPAYKTVVYDVIVEGPVQLSTVVGRSASLPGSQGDLIQRLQVADSAIIRLTNYGTGRDELATLPPVEVGEPPQRTPICDNPAMGWARVMFLSSAVAAFAAVRITAGLLLALAPLFAGLLLIEVARGIFLGWARALVFTLLASVAVSIMFGVQLALLEPWLAQVLQMRQGNSLTPSAPIELLVINLGFLLALGGTLAVLLRLAFVVHIPAAWRDLLKDHADITTRLRSLISVASSYGDKVLVEFVEATLSNTVKERDDLHTQLMALLGDADEAMYSVEADKLVRIQRKELSNAKAAVATLNDQIETLEFELADADQFIDHLRIAVNDFDDASSAFFALGAVRFEFCPSCFAPVKGHDHGVTDCHLCGVQHDKAEDETRALAVKLDLEMQINESLSLQTERQERLVELRSQLRSANARLKAATAASELGRRGAASKHDNLIADISRKIGFLDSQIDQLNHRVALAEEIATLTAEKEQLNERISRLKAQIETTNDAQTRRKHIAYTAVSENVKRLIARDLPEHNDYGDVRSFSFDFAGDWMAINGDKNRVGSASGMVVLKNSFLLSLFISSLNDAQFNLPRFMLMDNIEDKGMVQERSWNFQRLIVKASEASKADHQIIFSTSKIAPELEGSARVIGGKYTKQRRTLRIGN